MKDSVIQFFNGKMDELALYNALYERMAGELPDFSVKVSKTQISFSNKYGFAYVSSPDRRMRGRQGIYIIVTFGLNRHEPHPRIAGAVEPYPGRWTHHVVVQAMDEIDAQLMGWIKEAYAFSAAK